MESLPDNSFLRFNLDTLQYLRKQYNLDNPKRINDAIDILEDWLMKQDHFIVKKMSRDYLERTIILCKGSVEKAKKKIDTLSTYRTLAPMFFHEFDAEKFRNSSSIVDVLLPKMTSDNTRVYFLKFTGNKIDFTHYYKCFVAIAEYITAKDYCESILAIVDYTDTNILEVVKALNVLEGHQLLKIVLEAYGFRVKGIHLVTPSKFVNVMVAFLKASVNAKIGERIHAHKSMDEIYDIISQDSLPSDYGGKEKSLRELHEEFVDDLTTKEFTDHLAQMREARTNEDYRAKDTFNNEYMGTPGSFRSLCLD